jgi:Concanavalin A-like lectin/glucanases superfamily
VADFVYNGSTMIANGPRQSAALTALFVLVTVSTSRATLDGYWPVTEISGTNVDNTVATGTDATLFSGATFLTDPERGQVLAFDGIDGYADAGMIPQLTLTNSFTWSFWLLNQTDPVTLPNTVILGNRYAPPGSPTEYVPREFTKFTPTNFEYHRNGTAQNVNYPDYANPSLWTHVSVVKQADYLISYRNGLINGITRITEGQNNPHPLYFGGDKTVENWTGKLDDIAIWSDALPTSTVVGLAKGVYNPPTAPTTATPPTLQPIFSDSFQTGLTNWIPTNRGLENNAPAGYNPPDATGAQVSLSGTTNSQFWFGNSIESNQRFSSTLETLITVDRISLSGSGTAFRSSLWILGDDAHYLHYSQDVGETGWQWNARDDSGVGTLLPTGSGNNIPSLDALDADLGLHSMSIRLIPTGTLGEVNMLMYLDGTLVAGQGFSSFPSDFSIVLTGQARAIGDSVNAIFDNVLVEQIPEPTTAALFLTGLLGIISRARRRS